MLSSQCQPSRLQRRFSQSLRRLWHIEIHFPICDYVRLKEHLDRGGLFLSDVDDIINSSIKSRVDATSK